MKTTKPFIAFKAICAVFFFLALPGYFSSGSFAQNSNTVQDKKIRYMPDLKNWPDASQLAAKEIIIKYGMPDAVTEHVLIWYNNGPWKCTKVFDNESRHLFPASHTDVLEQTIDYKVPLNKFNDLALYNGSITVKRTDGEISTKCERECVNFLAINLANDIATGKKSVGEARIFYASAIKDLVLYDKISPYMQSFQFTTSKNKTVDADRNEISKEEDIAITKRIKEMNKGKEKEKLSTDRTVQ